MKEAGILALLALAFGIYIKFKQNKDEILKTKETEYRMNDLDLARQAKAEQTDIDTLKKTLAEKQSGKNLSPQEIEDFWRKN